MPSPMDKPATTSTPTPTPTPTPIRFPLGLNQKDVVGLGTTALVARLDAVIKFGPPSELPLLSIEKRIYERLGRDHDGILRYYGSAGDALVLQYACHGSIRQYCAKQGKPASLELQLRWVEQITASVAFIHSRNVMHGDISCNNVFLGEDLNAKLADFAGSSVDGQDTLICYEPSHECPEINEVSTESEIFALGSTFYEIMTGSKPYKELPDEEIALAYKEGKFPDLTSLVAFKDIIHKCWIEEYNSINEILEDVQAEVATKSKLVASSQMFGLQNTTILPLALAITVLPVLYWTKIRR